jgi:hypothetical protein
MNFSKITEMMFPVLILSIGWLLSQISDIQHNITILNSKISLVVTSDNNQAVNTGAELAREKLRMDLEKEIQKNRDDIGVNRQNIAIIEERLNRDKK